jgi:hypothetical protein
MKQPFSVLVAREQARCPWKTYSQICSELAKRPRKRRTAPASREIRLPYADN